MGIALMDETDVIERILRHLGPWEHGVRVASGRGPPDADTDEPIIETWLDDQFPDYDSEPVMAFAENSQARPRQGMLWEHALRPNTPHLAAQPHFPILTELQGEWPRRAKSDFLLDQKKQFPIRDTICLQHIQEHHMTNVYITLVDFMDGAPVTGAYVTVTVKVGAYPAHVDYEEDAPSAPEARPIDEQPFDEDILVRTATSADDGTVQCDFGEDLSSGFDRHIAWIRDRDEGNRFEFRTTLIVGIAYGGLERTVEFADPYEWSEQEPNFPYVAKIIVLDFAKLIVGHTTPSSTTLWFWFPGKFPAGRWCICDVYQLLPSTETGIVSGQGLFKRLDPRKGDKSDLTIDGLGPFPKAVFRQSLPINLAPIDRNHPDLGHQGVGVVDKLEVDSRYAFILWLQSEAEATAREKGVKIARGAFSTASASFDRLSFVFASCHLPIVTFVENPDKNLGRWEALGARQDYDLMLLIGDQIYGDEVRSYWPNNKWFTRYVKRYDQLWTYRAMREVFRRTAIYMVMDDHDVKDDWGTVPVYDNDDDEGKAFIAKRRLEAGLAAYRVFQHSHNPPTDQDKFFYDFRRGPASFFVMDSRSVRRMCRILIADFAAPNLIERLQREGYETRTTANGPEALRVADEFRPDVIVLGPPLLAQVKRFREQPWGMEIIMVGVEEGRGFPAQQVAWKQAGFDHVFSSSFPAALPDALIELLASLDWSNRNISLILGDAQRQKLQEWANDPETKAADIIFFIAPVPIAFLPVKEIQRMLKELVIAAGDVGWDKFAWVKGGRDPSRA